MKRRVVTNESFEKYIDYICRGKGRRFEDRFDSLDLDDITDKIDVPTESEVNSAIRELDLFDDAAISTGAQDIEVAADGKLRLLDFDPEGSPNKKSSEPDRDSRIAGLDLDDEPKKKDEPKPLPLGRRARANAVLRDLAKQQADAKSKEEPIRELDFDEKGKEVKQKKSNVGTIGALDYDDDIDTSKIAASIDNVYTALASKDPRIVKAMIKRYAGDITDESKIREVMLAHATELNYESLKAMCGDMRVALTQKEKNLGFINSSDIKEALNRFKAIASKLTGENNTHGLIPNAIVSCSDKDQIKCNNIIEFLVKECKLPIMPIYFRGAVKKRLYTVAKFLIKNLPEDTTFSKKFLTGDKGLITLVNNYGDVPNDLVTEIVSYINPKTAGFIELGEVIKSLLIKDNKTKIKELLKQCDENKKDRIIGHIADNDIIIGETTAYDMLAKMLRLKVTK